MVLRLLPNDLSEEVAVLINLKSKYNARVKRSLYSDKESMQKLLEVRQRLTELGYYDEPLAYVTIGKDGMLRSGIRYHNRETPIRDFVNAELCLKESKVSTYEDCSVIRCYEIYRKVRDKNRG